MQQNHASDYADKETITMKSKLSVWHLFIYWDKSSLGYRLLFWLKPELDQIQPQAEHPLTYQQKTNKQTKKYYWNIQIFFFSSGFC